MREQTQLVRALEILSVLLDGRGRPAAFFHYMGHPKAIQRTLEALERVPSLKVTRSYVPIVDDVGVGHWVWRCGLKLTATDRAKIPIKTKTCRLCQKTKEASEFSVDRSNPDGRRRCCRDCAKIYRRDWINKLTPEQRKKVHQRSYERRRRAEKRRDKLGKSLDQLRPQ